MKIINANKLKDEFEPKKMYTGAIIKHLIDNQSSVYDVDDVIKSLEKMQDTYRKLYVKRLEDYDRGFADGLEYALMELRGEMNERD